MAAARRGPAGLCAHYQRCSSSPTQCGDSLPELRNYTKAREYFEQILQMRKALHKGNHAEVAQDLSSWGGPMGA